MNYIVDNALVLIPALIIIGQIIKNVMSVPDWTIPLALLAPKWNHVHRRLGRLGRYRVSW